MHSLYFNDQQNDEDRVTVDADQNTGKPGKPSISTVRIFCDHNILTVLLFNSGRYPTERILVGLTTGSGTALLHWYN